MMVCEQKWSNDKNRKSNTARNTRNYKVLALYLSDMVIFLTIPALQFSDRSQVAHAKYGKFPFTKYCEE